MPRVSIIIPVYNAEGYIEETLESIFQQSYKDFEVLTVDDGSTDNTSSILKKYGKRLRYIYQENSGGCSKPRNVGISMARGELVAFFDADDRMRKDKIECQVQLLDSRPDIALSFTDFIDFSSEGQAELSHFQKCSYFQTLKKEKIMEEAFRLEVPLAYECLFKENVISPSSIMIRKGIGDTLGWFDLSLKSSEDIDFTFKVTHDYPIGFIDKVCHERRIHGSSMSSKTQFVLEKKIEVRKRQLTITKSSSAQKWLLQNLQKLYLSLSYYHRKSRNRKHAFSVLMEAIQVCPLSRRLLTEYAKIIFFL